MTATGYRFGGFRFDLIAYRGRRRPGTTESGAQAGRSAVLPAAAGTLVTKEELLDAVWPGWGNATAPQFIRTVARRGYRFIAPVTPLGERQPTPAPPPTGLPRLWLPKREDMHHIEAIPRLGTGKTDPRRVKQLAVEVAAARRAFI